MSEVKLLFIGDIAGKSGLMAVKRLLGKVVADEGIDFVVANGENVAGGVGITPELAKDLLSHNIHVLTTGNHVWRQREIRDYMSRQPLLLRPQNFLEGQPGRGFGVFETAAGVPVGVINLVGQVFMDPAQNPFREVERVLQELKGVKLILVDMHAEATSEKKAMALHLEGRVTAVLGTHTHVQTADEQVLPGGTAFITDVGMTGPHDSVIGMRADLVLERFRTGLPQSFKPAKGGARLQGAVVRADADTGRALEIRRVDIPMP